MRAPAGLLYYYDDIKKDALPPRAARRME